MEIFVEGCAGEIFTRLCLCSRREICKHLVSSEAERATQEVNKVDQAFAWHGMSLSPRLGRCGATGPPGALEARLGIWGAAHRFSALPGRFFFSMFNDSEDRRPAGQALCRVVHVVLITLR